MRKTLVVLGRPAVDSLCGAQASNYAEAARAAGREVRERYLCQLAFGPMLRTGHHEIQARCSRIWSRRRNGSAGRNSWLFVYPNRGGSVAALRKDFFEPVFLPGFAFSYRENSPLRDRLLAGRSAQLIVTMGTPRCYYRWIYRMPVHNQMKRTSLGFCGIRPVRVSKSAVVGNSSREQREKCIAGVRKLAQKA